MVFWIAFHVFIAGMIFLDLKGFKTSSIKGVLFWIALALSFNGLVALFLGKDEALTFFTAYLVETSLSIDNLFVFFMIFSFFGIEKKYQHRVLFWGVLGAFIFRIAFILLGVTLLDSFDWMYVVFGGILCVSAIIFWKSGEINIRDSRLFALAQKFLRIEKEFHEGSFFKKKRGKTYVTSLFLALLFVEAFDLVFAVDSIPAVLGITKDPFLAYTSNVFAVLGLRSFYLFLAKLNEKVTFLKPAILSILLFIGLKMVVSPLIHIPNLISLGAVSAILVFFVFLHILKGRRT